MLRKVYKIIVRNITRLSPTLASRFIYFVGMKRVLRLKNPQLYSEKLMKIKLQNYVSNSLVWTCADKFTVREYLSKKGIGAVNMPRIVGVYDNADDIDFDILPGKFALKCTHGAGFNIICKDKDLLDRKQASLDLNRWLVTDFGLETAETHYGKVQPRIICEEFIDSGTGQLPNDYKVLCFGGKPLFVMACTDRKAISKVNIMDPGWKDTGYIKPKYSSNKKIAKPETLDQMLEMAAKVSADFPFVRVDFYEEGGVPVLGEMTFTPHACVNSNMTEQGQQELGKLIV